jgi:hypothetical protein
MPNRGRESRIPPLLVALGLVLIVLGISIAVSTTRGAALQEPFGLAKTIDYPPGFGLGVPVGECVTVTLAFQNNTGEVKDVYVQDSNPRPAYLTILSDTLTGGSVYMVDRDAVVWQDLLSSGEVVTVSFQMAVVDGAGQKVVNYAWLDDPDTTEEPRDAYDYADIQIGPNAPELSPILNEQGSGDYTVHWTAVPPISSYTLEEDHDPAFSSAVTLYEGTATQLSMSRKPQGTWYYRVRASQTGSLSRWSSTQSVAVVLDTPVLAPIDNDDGKNSYTVEWSPVSGATGYTLQVDDDPAFATPGVAYAGAANQHKVNGQGAGTWHYRVRATNEQGTSSWSVPQSVMVKTTLLYLAVVMRDWPPLPPTPALDAISNPDGLGTYAVTWSPAQRAEGYILEEASNDDFSSAAVVYDGPLTSYQAEDRGPTRYYYRLRAYNSWGPSPWSGSRSTDVRWEREPNDTPSQANGPLLPDLVYRGTFPSGDDVQDYYYFYMTSPGQIELWLRNIAPGQNYNLVLRRDDLVNVGYSAEWGNANEYIRTETLPAGQYFVQVLNFGGGGSTQPYELVVSY